MGVAGNTTDLKLADTAGKRAKAARGTLAQWKERRAVVQGQQDALTNEMAQMAAMGRADLGCGLIAHVDGAGSLRINAGGLTPPEATLALRDHLCNVLGLPARFQDVTTLTKAEAIGLAMECISWAGSSQEMKVAIHDAAFEAILNALDHVGVIQSDPKAAQSATRQADGEVAHTTSAKPEVSAAPAGTAGSAQYEVSFNSESLHRVIEILDNTVRLIERVHNRGAISQDEFAEIGKKLSGLNMNLGLETTRVTKPANPNAASEDWDALHGINVDGTASKSGSSIDLQA